MRVVSLVLACLFISTAYGRDLGQWENTDPATREWYRGLMQPDVPNMSCCGEADAYWCDDYYVRDGASYCKITDDREDAPLGRVHVDVGREFEIPPNKLKWDRGNPTGHAIIFLSYLQYVYCYVQNGGT